VVQLLSSPFGLTFFYGMTRQRAARSGVRIPAVIRDHSLLPKRPDQRWGPPTLLSMYSWLFRWGSRGWHVKLTLTSI
jgi:hypothetical protein